MYCFLYNEKNEPFIALGPDWIFSLVEIAFFNSICGYILHSALREGQTQLFLIGLAILLLQDISFLFTVLYNPGLPSRDVAIHKQQYLNKVKILR
jgi:hypothetical protein